MSKDDHSRENDRQENNSTPSHLGREAKIGVTIILILLTGLAAAVVWRLRGSTTDGDTTIAASEPADSAEKPTQEDKTVALLKDSGSRHYGDATQSVAATPKIISAKPAEREAAKLDKWTVASDDGTSRRPHGSAPAVGSQPPSFAPDPPLTPRTDRYDRYATDRKSRSDEISGNPADRTSEGAQLMAPPDFHAAGGAMTNDYRRRWRDEVDHSEPVLSPPVDAADDYRRESVGNRYSSQQPRRYSSTTRYDNPPSRRNDGKYEVQPNDSFWTISERLYGTGAYFKALAEANRANAADDQQLRPGELIVAPSVAELEKSYPHLCPAPSRREAMQSQNRSRSTTVGLRNSYRRGRIYTVAEGDTLFDIARYELGQASRWAEIYELNRDVLGKDFNYLAPGTQLTLPDGEQPDSLAQPPSGTYRR